MTEQQWLALEDPQPMLEYLQYRDTAASLISNRKLRLFACACARSVWLLLTDERSRKAVEVAERYADGRATEEELTAARSGAWTGVRIAAWAAARATVREVSQAVAWATNLAPDRGIQAALLRDVVGNPFRRYAWPRVHEYQFLDERCLTPTALGLARAAYEERQGQKCELCEDGCEWWSPRVDRAFRACTWCGGTGRTGTAGTLDPDRLAVLSDALEDAGCTEQAILRHLRGEQWEPCDDHPEGCYWPLTAPHVRGCWAVDLILGRE